MSGKISKLKEDLKNIESETVQLAGQIREAYKIYLNHLSDCLYKQAVLAVYQICTRNYPAEFLALSYSQREKLQQDIKKLIEEIQIGLIQLVEIPIDKNIDSILDSLNKDKGINNQQNIFKLLLKNPPLAPVHGIDNPWILLKWIRVIEKSIADLLDYLNKKVNQQLQTAYVVPRVLSMPDINITVTAGTGKSENGDRILNLMIDRSLEEDYDNYQLLDDEDEYEEEETENETGERTDKEQFSPPPPEVTVFSVKGAEIEFAELELSTRRQKIRALEAKINNLCGIYQKTHAEYISAQADTAWRSSWHD